MKTGAMGLALAAISGLASAQPNVGAGNAQNPPNREPGGGRGGRGNFPGGRNVTPEQRREALRRFIEEREEQNIRDTLNRAGLNQQVQQDVVVAFNREQNAAQASLRSMAEKLVTSVSTPGVPDTEVARLLKELQDAVAKEKERRIAARTKLDGALNYTKQPRLELVLTMLGILGDDGLSAGNVGGGLGGRFGGGGFGGGIGGGFGGGR